MLPNEFRIGYGRFFGLFFALSCAFILSQGHLQAATYDVGSGYPYVTIASVPVLQPGDVVNIHCGTFNEIRQWLDNGTPSNPITLQGVCSSAKPIIDGTGQDASGNGSQPRGDWEIQGSNYIIRNLEFRNAHNGNNAAGLRVMNANVTVTNCLMDNNDMGILTSTTNVDNMLVQSTEVANNGTGYGDGLSHNVYLTAGITITFSNCYIHDSNSGENFKSRAHYVNLFYNFIAYGAESEVESLDNTYDTADANSNMTMIGNVLVSMQYRTINDTKFINFGQDTGGPHNGTLYLINNTLIAGSTSIGFVRTSAPGVSVVATNNIFYGSNNIVQAGLANGISGSNNWFPNTAIVPPNFTAITFGADPGLANIAGGDYHLLATSTARNIGLASPVYYDGNGVSHSGVPTLQYVQPLSITTRPSDTGMDAGAYGFGSIAGSPDLTISVSHTGNFTQGQSGTYTLAVSNVGTAATTGTVNVSDTLPTGLAVSTISGSGWTCSVSPLGCTRGDSLGAGLAYPSITLNVGVASNAPASVTNSGSVSGGGETNTGNDTSANATTINPASAPGAPGTASFVKTDTTTAGSWKGVYGADGAAVIGDTSAYPSYVTVTPAGNSFWMWTSSTSDTRAPQKLSASDRVAACWYSSSSFTVDLNINDGKTHQVAVYVMDWDNWFGRTERLDILDSNGNVLDSRSAAGFQGGQYFVWSLSGHVVVRLTNTNPNSNGVMSGIFFGASAPPPPPPATGTAAFVKTDTATAGSWKGVYGADGAAVIGDTTAYPSYVSVTPAGNSSWVWTSSTSDTRAPQKLAASDRVAACWYSSSSFTLDLNFTDGNTHQVAVYVLDWDNYFGRTERLDVLDTSGNVLDTRSAVSFQGGQYFVWNLSGHVVVRLTNTNPNSNAVMSGIFFGGAGAAAPAQIVSTAAFVKNDPTTSGSWQSVYGLDGAAVMGDTSVFPSYVTLTPAANSFWSWTSSTSDTRAPQRVTSSGREAACWYSGTSFTIDLNFSDSNTHQVSLYLLDWDSYQGGRTERLEILDPSGNVLDTRNAASFQNGQYFVWNVSGHVVARITNTNPASNAVISGVFFR